jgi:hypothetical protein
MLRVLTYAPRLLRSSRPFSASTPACADPWPLPHTPEHLESTKTPEDIPPPAPLLRPNESIETMRARLVYQSRKRGTLESDLLLSTFARDALAGMGEEELREYDKVRLLVWQLFVLLYLMPWWCFSSSMNRIGTYTTGRRISEHPLNDGQTRRFSRDSERMRRTRARSSEACLRYRC